ncbi:transcriptional regulator MntR [Persicirhabdus sediminis]|uniref:Transcriptional regulator MntR n=1 Tax=Persicirhabdus sediminis TaxID=454144 RepID=A0A8J7MFD5_9BACT|nr:transcriptional regulator MntR [Persicirhabdus sediminis]MBK1791678.1 transcriptional regulator MntR [Persicirhabdus sediminis]
MAATPQRTSGSVARDDYLEQIYHLMEQKGYARAVDISRNLGISQSSVTNMLQKLDAEGLLNYERYRGITLTEQGTEIAKAIIARHEMLTRFLRLFGIAEETIYADVEGMEHHVSRATLEAIRALTQHLETNPATLKEIVSQMSLPES